MNPESYEEISDSMREWMKQDFTNMTKTPYEQVKYSIFRNIREKLINETKGYVETLSDAEESNKYNQMLMRETIKQVAC